MNPKKNSMGSLPILGQCSDLWYPTATHDSTLPNGSPEELVALHSYPCLSKSAYNVWTEAGSNPLESYRILCAAVTCVISHRVRYRVCRCGKPPSPVTVT